MTEQEVHDLARGLEAETTVPAAVLTALAYRESRIDREVAPVGRGLLNPGAVGTAGEVGLAQVKPDTARGEGFRGSVAELAEPRTNLRIAGKYLAKQRAAFGSWAAALGAYNAGPGRYAGGYRGNDSSYVLPILQRANAWLQARKGRGSSRWLVAVAFAAVAAAVLSPRGR